MALHLPFRDRLLMLHLGPFTSRSSELDDLAIVSDDLVSHYHPIKQEGQLGAKL